jgi:hypothetical protein
MWASDLRFLHTMSYFGGEKKIVCYTPSMLFDIIAKVGVNKFYVFI